MVKVKIENGYYLFKLEDILKEKKFKYKLSYERYKYWF